VSLQLTATPVKISTPDAAQFGIFAHGYKDVDGIDRYRIEFEEGDPDRDELIAFRGLLEDLVNPPRSRLAVVPTEPTEPVCVSREIVAGVEVTEYLSAEDGPTVALETDEVVHVEHLPELIKHLTAIHEEHRRAEARSYFASEDAIDPSKHTVQSLARFAEGHGFDVPAFMTVAAEVMSR